MPWVMQPICLKCNRPLRRLQSPAMVEAPEANVKAVGDAFACFSCGYRLVIIPSFIAVQENPMPGHGPGKN